jgi:predicted nuclease of predicted toxin-antitoxin system
VRFFLDHDVPADVAVVLRTRGHDVVQLREILSPETPDDLVWSHSRGDGRIMVSCNRAHFVTLALATETHPGLIVLKRRRTRQAEAAHVLDLLAKAGAEGLVNNINFA